MDGLVVMQTYKKNEELAVKIQRTRFIFTDVDGVLTDGSVTYGPEGEAFKIFNIRDGMGVERLRQLAGVETGIITGEMSPSVKKRAEKLKITELHLGAKDKLSIVRIFAEQRKLSLSEIAFIGDDVNDLEVLKAVGLSACPGDAMPEVRDNCDYICHHFGGRGAFREFAELILAHKSISNS